MANTKNHEDRRAVLAAVGYEFDQLIGMHLLRTTARWKVDEKAHEFIWLRNALLESQCVHVRTLIEFFFLEDPNRITASACVPEWPTQRPEGNEALGTDVGRLYGDLNARLSHVYSPRKGDRVWDDLPTITAGLIETVRIFAEQLGDRPNDLRALRSKMPQMAWDGLPAN
ncbi:MAG: hypothetical protein DWP92_02090 [Armatimonadetes bacterium]|nr:MAG: hypothetical protein DWP92_02090 [Armatimonadota bacterium]MCZ7532360.1 hypothetical protein [Acidimicrobiia bacterium]